MSGVKLKKESLKTHRYRFLADSKLKGSFKDNFVVMFVLPIK